MKKLVLLIFTINMILLASNEVYRHPERSSRTASKVLTYIFEDTKFEVRDVLKEKMDSMMVQAHKKGLEIEVVSEVRSFDIQGEYYARGRFKAGSIITNAPPGFSYHNYGWAMDIRIYKNGKQTWDEADWAKVGKIGTDLGLIWGGNWKSFVDKPHFQLSLLDIMYSYF